MINDLNPVNLQKLRPERQLHWQKDTIVHREQDNE
jgi:hypothetical protein